MAFKMKGFPMQQTAVKYNPKALTPKQKNLLEAVPDKEAYDKLSDIDKRGFNDAAREAGLPTKPIKYKAPLKQVDPTFGQKIGKNKVDLGKYVLDISSKEGKDFFEKYKNIKTVSSSEPSRVGKTTAQQLNIPEGNKSKIRNILKKTTKLGGKALKNLIKLAGGTVGALAQFMLMPVEAGASEAEWQKENWERMMRQLEKDAAKNQSEEGGEDKIIIE
tara:strand:- start:2364 stop:3017 length:654 start_codon:yes stop_codon:yes gene_type:complete